MFWIWAGAVLGAVLAVAWFVDRRGRSRGPRGPLDSGQNATARDEHVRHRLENPSGEHGPRP